MLWIKEVEMVESADDLKSSRSIKGTHGPDFELLDARIASALNRIIQNTRFKKKVSPEERKAHKEDRFSRGRQIAFLIYEYFRVTGAKPDNHRLKTMVKSEELWSQKWKFWNKRRGQESEVKTAWTNKSRRLLAMES